MSTIVKDINDAIEGRVSAILSDWTELSYIFEIEKNKFNKSKDRYGVRPLPALTVPGVTKVYTVDHDFEIILMSSFVNKGIGDQAQKAVMFDLYDNMDEVFKDLYLSKAGIAATILNINSITLAEPEFLEEDNVVALRAIITVKYRNDLS